MDTGLDLILANNSYELNFYFSEGSMTRVNKLLLYAQIQEAIVEHFTYLWCYQGVEFHVERNEMNGYVYNSMCESYFYHHYKSTEVLSGPPTILIQVLLASVYLGICIIAIVVLKRSSKG